MHSSSGSLRLRRFGEGVLVGGLGLLEEARGGGLFRLLRFAGVELPAGADGHHEEGDEYQHQHVCELVGRDNAEVVLLALQDLLLRLLLQLCALGAADDAVNVLLVARYVLQQHLVEVAPLCPRHYPSDLLGSHHLLVPFGNGGVLADEGGDLRIAVLPRDLLHALLDEGEQVSFISLVGVVLSAHQPTPKEQLHSAPHVLLLEQLHVFGVLRLGWICLDGEDEKEGEEGEEGEWAHPSIQSNSIYYIG